MADRIIERSEFGYWIRPDGEVIPMTELQAHGRWIIANGIVTGESDPTFAAERAVLEGWIAVSLSPVGTSCGVRVRKASVTKRTADALRVALRASGFLKEDVHVDLLVNTEGQVEYRSGKGSDIASAIWDTAWDDLVSEDPSDDVDLMQGRIELIRRRAVLKISGHRALSEGALPNAPRVAVEMRLLDTAVGRIRKEIYGWSDEGWDAKSASDMDALRAIILSVRSSVLEQADIIELASDGARAALCGIELARGEELASDWRPGLEDILLPGENALDALPRLSERRERLMKAAVDLPDPASAIPEALQKRFTSISTAIIVAGTLAGTLRGHIRKLDAAARVAPDAKKLHEVMTYYLCHECGRTTSARRANFTSDLWSLVEELRARQSNPGP